MRLGIKVIPRVVLSNKDRTTSYAVLYAEFCSIFLTSYRCDRCDDLASDASALHAKLETIKWEGR